MRGSIPCFFRLVSEMMERKLRLILISETYNPHRLAGFELTMDASKALDDDGPAPQVSGFQCCVFPAAPLTVILVPHYHPRDPLSLGGQRKRS